MIEVIKKDDESVESFIRRFSKKTQQSRVLQKARKKMYYQRPLSDKLKREEATRRKRIKERREYLRKIGKIGLYRNRNRAPRRPAA